MPYTTNVPFMMDEEFNLDEQFPEDTEFPSPPIEVLDLARCVVTSIIGVVCVVGNVLVLRTLLCFKYPKIPMYVAIGGLALSDLLRASIEVPNNIINWTHNSRIVTSLWCKASRYLMSSSMYIAASHLVILSVIRGILLNDRGHGARSFVPHAFVASLGFWAVCLLANIPNIMRHTKDEELNKCVEEGSGLSESDEKELWLRVSFSYIVPVVVIIVTYFVTYCCSKRYFEDSYSNRERRLSRMVTILVVTWAIFKLPFEILNLIVFYRSRVIDQLLVSFSENTEEEFSNYLFLEKVEENMECLSLVDLAIRPIVYAKLSYYFSKSFDEVINCTSCRESRRRGFRDSSKIRHARMSERISESEAQAQTPLTEITLEVTQTELCEAEVTVHNPADINGDFNSKEEIQE